MARWQPAPIVGGAYSDDTMPWSVQDTVNYILVPAEGPGTRSSGLLRSAPGLMLFADLGTNAPIRGMRNVEGTLLAVSGNHLYKIKPDGTSSQVGVVPGVGRVSMSHNQVTGGNQVVIANGQSGYVYSTVDGSFVQITDDAFMGAISFDFVDGYITGIEPGRRFAFTSDLADALSYSSLDRYEAEGKPDRLMGQAVTHREWWLFGERTIEPYLNTGSTEGTFQRSQGTVIEIGAASPYCMSVMDNSVMWLGNDGIVYRANGYTPQRISTHAIEQELSRSNIQQAFSFTFEDRGHKIYYLTLPDGHTWGWDAATNEWHRRQSNGLKRWRINDMVRWQNVWLAGDYSNGKIYQLDWSVQDENGEEMERRRVSGVLHDNQNRVIVNGLELVIDTGLGPNSAPLPAKIKRAISITGNAVDGTINVPYSYSYTINSFFPTYTVSLSYGSLPPGLSLSATGVLSGTPTQSGTFNWKVAVTDVAGNVGTKDDGIVVDVVRAARFHGPPDSLYTPFAAPILGASAFTVECRGRFDQPTVENCALVSGRADNAHGWALQVQDGALHWRQSIAGFLIDDPGSTLNGGIIPANQMVHLACTRNGDVFSIWVDGSLVATKTVSGTINEPGVTNLALGTSLLLTAENESHMWIDWFALTIGSARYTSTFTPPTSAADVVGATSAIDFKGAIGSSTFTDYSGRAWSRNGTVDIEAMP